MLDENESLRRKDEMLLFSRIYADCFVTHWRTKSFTQLEKKEDCLSIYKSRLRPNLRDVLEKRGSRFYHGVRSHIKTIFFLLAAKRNIPHVRDCFIRKFLPFLSDGRTTDNRCYPV